jgi:hypothetical protein
LLDPDLVTPRTRETRHSFFRVARPHLLSISDAKGVGCAEYFEEFREYTGTFDYSLPRLRARLAQMRKTGVFPGNHSRDREIEIQKMMVVPQFFWWKDNIRAREPTFEKAMGKKENLISRIGPCDNSRVGYKRDGEVLCIICPQMGYRTSILGAFSVEVTVTRCRGYWTPAEADIDIEAVGQMWLTTEDGMVLPLLHLLRFISRRLGISLPLTKATAVRVAVDGLTGIGSPLNMRDGFKEVPGLERTSETGVFVQDAMTLCGYARATEDEKTEASYFRGLLIELFNLFTGGILTDGQFLAWNIQMTGAKAVDHHEWHTHTERMRLSKRRLSLFGQYYQVTKGIGYDFVGAAFHRVSSRFVRLARSLGLAAAAGSHGRTASKGRASA